MTKPVVAARKPARCKPDPKPTIEEIRSLWHREQRYSANLQRELNKARATIDALAWVLSMRPQVSDNDIPF